MLNLNNFIVFLEIRKFQTGSMVIKLPHNMFFNNPPNKGVNLGRMKKIWKSILGHICEGEKPQKSSFLILDIVIRCFHFLKISLTNFYDLIL